MSTHTYLDCRFDVLAVTCDREDPTVRISAERGSVSLRLELDEIERLETALACARMNLVAQAARRVA